MYPMFTPLSAYFNPTLSLLLGSKSHRLKIHPIPLNKRPIIPRHIGPHPRLPIVLPACLNRRLIERIHLSTRIGIERNVQLRVPSQRFRGAPIGRTGDPEISDAGRVGETVHVWGDGGGG